MLNYDYQVSGKSNKVEGSNKYTFKNLLANPFPGLRPFDLDECHLFFGRERHVDEILLKLSNHKFVSVLGYSGSGKSSLMHCGVLPVLYGGFMTHTSAEWTIIKIRPGSDPIGNLSKYILKECGNITVQNNTDYSVHFKTVQTLLRSGADGLNLALARYSKDKEVNYLFLIDQFEELFRFKKDITIPEAVNDAIAFVNLLVYSVKEDNPLPVYVAITMRSDLVGECSKYEGLTTLINNSNYLVPRMTLQQKRIVIEGPILVAGGRIHSRLVKRLLHEIGDNQDQLPILQHALMRTWAYWVNNHDDGELIDLRHYNAIGKMSGALSQHADEIYEELSNKQKLVAETLFKTLTQKGQDSQGMRRPAKLNDIAQLAGVSNEEVMEVVESFRQPGRSFLMPSYEVPLKPDTFIEISHESLMRIWVRLKNWVDEEYESAQMYIRLSEAAEMYQIGQTGLWRPPDLQLALNWQKKQRPNRLWAKRYNEAFERAIVFLDTSRITYDAEQKAQQLLQKRLLNRTRTAAIILGIAFIIAIVFFVYGYIQQVRAETQAQLAIENEAKATESAEKADLARLDAVEAEKIASQQKELAQQRAKDLSAANEKLEQAINNLQIAINNEKSAKNLANTERVNAINQTVIAQKERLIADSAKVVAQSNFNNAQRLLYLQVAQSMAAKSLNQSNNDLHGLLAYQAFIFNTKYEGRKYDPYIYNGLYTALSKIDGKTYNTVGVHGGSARSVSFPNSSDIYYTAGSDGKVYKNSMNPGVPRVELSSSKYRNKIVEISKDGNYLVSGGDSSFINVFKLNNLQAPPKKITVHGGGRGIFDIQFLPDGVNVVTSGGDKTIKLVNIETGKVDIIKSPEFDFKVLDVTPDGKRIIAGAESGRVSLFDIATKTEKVMIDKNNSPIYAISFSTDGKQFAVGDESGKVELWNISGVKLQDLNPHTSRVTSIQFSNDGGLIASSSLDKTVNIWVLNELNDLPITLNDNDAFVWDLAFSPDPKYLLAACEDGEIRVWTTNSDIMAKNMCDKLSRNMTLEEWEIYTSNDIPYMNTCVDKLIER